MRVFYTDESEDDKIKQYFINIENINIPDNLKGTKAFDSKTIVELKDKIIKYYGFNLPNTIELQLWSGPTGTTSTRVDTNENTSEVSNIWVKAVNK